jgi:hypothetical protein
LQHFFIQLFLLSGVALRTEKLDAVTSNRFYLLERFLGIIAQNGIIMLLVTKLVAPMLRKISFYNAFDHFLMRTIQKSTINALNRYVFNPIVDNITKVKEKLFS